MSQFSNPETDNIPTDRRITLANRTNIESLKLEIASINDKLDELSHNQINEFTQSIIRQVVRSNNRFFNERYYLSNMEIETKFLTNAQASIVSELEIQSTALPDNEAREVEPAASQIAVARLNTGPLAWSATIPTPTVQQGYTL